MLTIIGRLDLAKERNHARDKYAKEARSPPPVQVHRTETRPMMRAKYSLFKYQFLYVCLVFSCVFSRFYVYFNVISQFWKEMEEISSNRAEIGENGQN